MKKQILFFSTVLLPLAVLSNEPSAYGAGDLDSKSSYGITSSEKKIFQNNDRTGNTSQNIASTKTEISNSNEQYEGVRSIMDGYGNKIAKMDERIRSLEKTNDELKTENNQLKEYAAESRKLRNDDQEKIKAVLSELSSLIDSINKNYVPKDKFDQLANEIRGKGSAKVAATPDTTKKETAKDSKPVTSKELSTKDSATLIKEADDLYEKKSYNEAKVLYGELLNRNYKPAKVNYNLGEIAYTQKSYTSAIEHYKTSISLVEKAAYAPTLLYHTGSSFEKLSKNKEAQAFYKALKDTYPDSPEAKKIK